MANQSAEHHRLVKEVLLGIGSDPRIRIWQNNTGVGRSLYTEDVIRFGLEGSPDIVGIHRGTGKFCGIEIKTGKAKQSKEQCAFQRMVQEFNGHYLVCRSVAEAKEWLDRIS